MSENHMVVGALGDSITTAFNAQAPRDNWALSWATGDAAESHASRLRRLYPGLNVKTQNVAVSGARAAALPVQAERLAAHKPDYVTALIGANDLVQGAMVPTRTLVDFYERDVSKALEKLIAASPRVMILLAGIPNQAHLLELGLGPQLLPMVDPTLVARLRALYVERWEAMNERLARLATKHAGNVRFAPGVALAKFGEQHLSPLDAYHPSHEGQKLLAELTWREGWFPAAG